MMKKDYKIEISKKTISIIIVGLFSLLSLSVKNYFIFPKEILHKLKINQNEITDKTDILKLIMKNDSLLTIIDSISSYRVLNFLDSELTKNDILFRNDDVDSILQLSANKKFEINNEIGKIESLPEIDDETVDINNVNDALIEILRQEIEIWKSLDNYMIKFKQGALENNTLLFKQLDNSIIDYYFKSRSYQGKQNRQTIQVNKMAAKVKLNYDTTCILVYDNVRNKRYSLLGIIICTLLLIPFIRITFKEMIGHKK